MLLLFILLIPIIVIIPDKHCITKYKGGRELFKWVENHQMTKTPNDQKQYGVEVWGKRKLGLQEKE